MVQEAIIIKNFGPVKHIEIEDIRPFTVFIGESGSGKSTIMKVIILFRWIYKWVNIRSYLKHSNISKSLVEFEFKELLKKNGLLEYLKDNTEIIYKKGSATVHYKKDKLVTSDLVPKDELSLEKMCFVADRRNIIPDILANKMNLQTDFYLQETLNDILLALNQIAQPLHIAYLGIKFVVKKEGVIPRYLVENIGNDEPYSINLYNASSGTQTLIPLSVIVEHFARHYDFNSRFNNIVLDYLSRNDSLKDFRAVQNIGDIKHRNVHIHIEEPELSLFPESQRSLINFIVNRCFVENHKDYNMTVMMATHSPYIINHLNLLIKARDKNKLVEGAQLNYDDVSVYQVDEGEIFDLKIANKKLINTNPLSETINDIYEEYNQL